ncbi:MAG: hypothetical protein SVU32_00965 [Candidatus Nanohaloarchaea archaeon]|nr:hypothetical protein [Candidatus Nanohaloarchaea archaeon]
MARAGPLATILYGVKLIAYMTGIFVLGFAPIILGFRPIVEAAVTRGPMAVPGSITPLNLLLIAFGAMILVSGQLGMLFKVITDAVNRGNRGHERELLADVTVETDEETEATIETDEE